jgi:acetyl esterase/lipase
MKIAIRIETFTFFWYLGGTPVKVTLLSLAGLSLLLAAFAPVLGGGDDKKPARISDVVFGRKDGLALTMDVIPPTGKPNGAAVVMIASANFKSNLSDVQPIFTAELEKRGYTCFIVGHGSQPRYTVPEIRDDIQRVVRFIRYHAKKYDIDPNRIGMGGVSSGGMLALLVGTAPQQGKADARDPVDRVDSNVQAVAVFFPPTDYFNYGTKGNEYVEVKSHGIPYRAPHDFREFDAKEGVFEPITDIAKRRAIYREISPIYHVTAKTAPTLLFHGDKDELVPLQQSESFFARLQEAKVPSRLEVRKGAGHGWITMVADLTIVADWFDAHLKKK